MQLRRPPLATVAVAAGATVILAMAVFLLLDLRHATELSKRAETTARISDAYQRAHAEQAREEVVLNAFLDDPRDSLRATQAKIVARVDTALRQIPVGSDSAAIIRIHADYVRAAERTFGGDGTGAAVAHEQSERLELAINDGAGNASHRALALGTAAHATQRQFQRAGTAVAIAGVAIFFTLGTLLWRGRRRLDAARAGELARLAELASSDPLTGLRNHRTFQEDLVRELQRVGRTGLPLSLVLLDVDDLKSLNDTAGHQAGDERLCALADAIRATQRATDCAYRIGGDEFAVILPDSRPWGALEFAQRLRASLPGFTATAGIAGALSLCPRDQLVREADLALLGAKSLHQEAAIYTDDMLAVAEAPDVDEHHTRTLASALARAVDAKDSYTRSHCQTVSQLAAVVATQLGFEGERLARMRLAGLLHDVGKIGVPDAILNKPEKLTDAEYVVMQDHSLLGFEIVQAAGLPEEARWVRHHHERIDGRGYPDRLAGDAIPLESRIILVADAFEAMTSDRPYRRAPGREFAVQELRRGAGTQFDPAVVDALCDVLDRLPAAAEHALLAN